MWEKILKFRAKWKNKKFLRGPRSTWDSWRDLVFIFCAGTLFRIVLDAYGIIPGLVVMIISPVLWYFIALADTEKNKRYEFKLKFKRYTDGFIKRVLPLILGLFAFVLIIQYLL